MKDDHIAFYKPPVDLSACLEIISFMILFFKHADKTTDTHAPPVSEDEYIMINTDYLIDYDANYNNNPILNPIYNVNNMIENDINYLDTDVGATPQVWHDVGSPGPMDGG